jgi:2Fe-2S ferredoxin
LLARPPHARAHRPPPPAAKPSIKVTFIKPTGERVTVSAPIGDSLLEVAHANKIDVEGACGGETACSTCHVILTKPFFDKVPEPSEAEEDMLDLALGLTKTSRLGCQVFAASNLDGMEVTLPKEVNNMKKDD